MLADSKREVSWEMDDSWEQVSMRRSVRRERDAWRM